MRALVALVVGLMVACHPVTTVDTNLEPRVEIADLVERTVQIKSVCFAAEGISRHTGSGAIIRTGPRGSQVITAKHVVEDDSCVVTVEDQYDDSWVAFDIKRHPEADVAVFSILGTYSLPTLKVGKPRYDQDLITLGYPYDAMVQRTVFTITRGTTAASYEGKTFFRMTAPILPGASGSAVYDYRTGALIGVVSMYISMPGNWRAPLDAHYYAEYADYVLDLLDIPTSPRPSSEQSER